MATVLKKTTCESLQKHLENWVTLVDTAVAFTNPSAERSDAIMAFCRVFVPADVSEDDIDHFSGMCTTDEEFFESLQRELRQCASGENVDSIIGNQKNKAVFTLLPPEGAVSEGFSLDIVREVSFISKDSGVIWTAEG